MKEVINTFAQLAAIIMIVITLAVSSAAVSQWVRGLGTVTEATATETATNVGAATQLPTMASLK